MDIRSGSVYLDEVTPDHNPNDGAAPEQYDADWFLSQLRGRQDGATASPAPDSGEPADLQPEVPAPLIEPTAKRLDAPVDEVEPEPEAEVGVIPEPEPEAEVGVVPEPEPEVEAVLEPDPEVAPEPVDQPVDEPVELAPALVLAAVPRPPSAFSRLGARGRRAGLLGGIAAAAAVIAVAGAAFASSGMPPVPVGMADADEPPAASESTDPTRSPEPSGTQLPTLPDSTAPDRGAPEWEYNDEPVAEGPKAHDPGTGPGPSTGPTNGPTSPPTTGPSPEPSPSPSVTPSPTPSDEPTPDPTPSDDPTPDPEPSDDPTPDPEPSPDPDPSPGPVCELLPILC